MPNNALAPVLNASFAAGFGRTRGLGAAVTVLGAMLFTVLGCASSGGGGPTSQPGIRPEPASADEPVGFQGFLRGDGRSVLLVFSREVDPATLTPEVFVVMRADGEITRLERASLGRSNEVDEHRSVWLEWSSSVSASPAPVAVQVVGPLFAEDGRSLQGLRTKLAPADQADAIVRAEIAPGDCLEDHGGAAPLGANSWRVRSYWSDAMWLRGQELGALGSTELELADGRRIRLRAVADVEARTASDSTDNVVDLCFAAPDSAAGSTPRASQLIVPMGALVDAQGRGNAGQRVKLGAEPRDTSK